MKHLTLIQTFFLCIVVAGCSPSPKEAAKDETKIGASDPSKAELSASGNWTLRTGKASESLQLSESGGVIKGAWTQDPAFGKATYPVTGLRVGREVELSYSYEKENKNSDDHKSAVSWSFKGAIDGNKMSGKCILRVVSFFKSGGAIPSDTEMLWVAERK